MAPSLHGIDVCFSLPYTGPHPRPCRTTPWTTPGHAGPHPDHTGPHPSPHWATPGHARPHPGPHWATPRATPRATLGHIPGYIEELYRSVPVSQCPSVPGSQGPSVPVSRCLSAPVSQCPSVPVYQCPNVPVSQCTTTLLRSERDPTPLTPPTPPPELLHAALLCLYLRK